MPDENTRQAEDAAIDPDVKREEAEAGTSVNDPDPGQELKARSETSMQPDPVSGDESGAEDRGRSPAGDPDGTTDNGLDAGGPVEPGPAGRRAHTGSDSSMLDELDKLKGIDDGAGDNPAGNPYGDLPEFSSTAHAGEPGFDVAEARPAGFQQLGGGARSTATRNLNLLMDVTLPISIELGRTAMSIQDILNLGPGSVVELNKLAGEPVDLLVNNKIVAKGEVVVIDENFGIRVTSLVSPEERLKSLGE